MVWLENLSHGSAGENAKVGFLYSFSVRKAGVSLRNIKGAEMSKFEGRGREVPQRHFRNEGGQRHVKPQLYKDLVI
ncbi:hypothetical protein CMUST_11925 [Corynebacterium mustelae]|uniref:Uncharacterized protein n=1 Tax=Corynebacterium mustelae TaxID=571915 RepID=A0A0G3GZY2_9CORY|nr:hypothetical protein CMUST_11925 [Corynebacterium mustelae]